MPKELKNLPSANVIANVGGEKLVKEASEITGELLYKSGFNLNFAPVLDLRRYEKQKVIGDRSFGYDKEKVSPGDYSLRLRSGIYENSCESQKAECRYDISQRS